MLNVFARAYFTDSVTHNNAVKAHADRFLGALVSHSSLRKPYSYIE